MRGPALRKECLAAPKDGAPTVYQPAWMQGLSLEKVGGGLKAASTPTSKMESDSTTR